MITGTGQRPVILHQAMVNKTTVLDGQTLADIAVQETGTVESLFELAEANGKSITDIPDAGEKLLPLAPSKGGGTWNKDVADYYRAKNIKPVTRLMVDEGDETLFEEGLYDEGLFE